ncbi:MAG TPA: 6-pyruvoyl-tetrahydropterin synthase-related protein [Terriglobales bacterium]|nr:6-pyruvoyl-tetrahydropterin synthase-related protein [Terriglobales bacterium]
MGTQVNETGREITAERTPTRGNSTIFMVVLVSVAALAVVAPFFFLGNASGHDFEFHLASWMDVARQWHEGVLYPRWAALANWGFGEPRFIFYPPASWMLGAALSFVFPWPMVPGAFIWLVLTIAGVSMFALAKEWLPTRDAMAAGALFALNPYHLVIVYWRSDFAELLASALLPLVVLFAMRSATDPRRAFVPLALATAAVWLSNAPAAVVVTYTIALILAVVAVRERSAWPLIYGGGALALGLALATFYIIPAAFEQSWVNISEVISQGLEFPENFLFTRTADAEHTRFNFIVSWIAVEMIVITVAAITVAGRLRREHPRLWWVLAALGAVSTVLMLPLTSPIWAHLPELRYVQFPWRWLLVLDVPFAFCLAGAMGRLRSASKHAAWAVALAGLAATGFVLTRGNWWDSGGVAKFREEHFNAGAGYFGTDEYGPRGSDHYDLDPHAPLVGLRHGENAVPEPSTRVQVHEWGPIRKEFGVHSPEPVTAALRLLNYPAWQVAANGKPVRPLSNQNTGQMLILLPAGTSRVQVAFAATPDRRWGDIISAIAAVMLLAAVLASRRRSTTCVRTSLPR